MFNGKRDLVMRPLFFVCYPKVGNQERKPCFFNVSNSPADMASLSLRV